MGVSSSGGTVGRSAKVVNVQKRPARKFSFGVGNVLESTRAQAAAAGPVPKLNLGGEGPQSLQQMLTIVSQRLEGVTQLHEAQQHKDTRSLVQLMRRQEEHAAAQRREMAALRQQMGSL